MDESEFITAIYQQGNSLKLLKILDKVEAPSANELKFKHFSLKHFAEHLERNQKKGKLSR
jgi:hypothetical protein